MQASAGAQEQPPGTSAANDDTPVQVTALMQSIIDHRARDMPIFASAVDEISTLLPHTRAMTPGVVLPMLRALDSLMHASVSFNQAVGHSLTDAVGMLTMLPRLDPVLTSHMLTVQLVPHERISSFFIYTAFTSCILRRFDFGIGANMRLHAAYRQMHAHCQALFTSLCCQITNPRHGEDKECTDLTGDTQVTEHVHYVNFDARVKDCIKRIALMDKASFLLP